MGQMTISTDGFRIPVTLQLRAGTYRAIYVAAKRASVMAGREVTVRELIETRLDEAITGVGRPVRQQRTPRPKRGRGDRLSPQEVELLVSMDRDGATAMEIADAVGCSMTTVANHRKKIHAKGAPNV